MYTSWHRAAGLFLSFQCLLHPNFFIQLYSGRTRSYYSTVQYSASIRGEPDLGRSGLINHDPDATELRVSFEANTSTCPVHVLRNTYKINIKEPIFKQINTGTRHYKDILCVNPTQTLPRRAVGRFSSKTDSPRVCIRESYTILY